MSQKTAGIVRNTADAGSFRTWHVSRAGNLRLFTRGFRAVLKFIKTGAAGAKMLLVAAAAHNAPPTTKGEKTMKKIQVYRTLLEAMTALANKKNQEFYHVTKDDNGWYRVVKN